MSEMVERVARALIKNEFGIEPEVLTDAILDQARVAIAAMREPTEAMLTAGSEWAYAGCSSDTWHWMIEEALR